MKNNLKSWQSVVAMTGMIVGLAILMASAAWAGKGTPNPRVIPPPAHPFGKSYGEWSAEWWKWHFRLPDTNHPAYSEDGMDCGAGQSGKVWFLAGAFANEVPASEFNTIVRESCCVPTGKAIFFPILNVECSTVEEEPFEFDGNNPECPTFFFWDPNDPNPDCRAFAFVEGLSVTIDGKPLENIEDYRFQSPVFNFEFEDPEDNILGVDCKGDCEDEGVDCCNPQAVSDGYWIMLPPLSKGEHTINFTGSFIALEDNSLLFGLDVTYILTVVGGRK